jgi:hypothetical protein
LPAANIEGHYIIQDLQMKRQLKTRIFLEAESAAVSNANLSEISTISSSLSGIYMGANPFEVSNTVSTGITNISSELETLGGTEQATDISSTKVYGSIINADYRRRAGYKFGY